MSTLDAAVKVGLSMDGMPSLRGPPEVISLKSTDDFEKSVLLQLRFRNNDEPGSKPGINHQTTKTMTTIHIRL
jgi:hypothetical protein